MKINNPKIKEDQCDSTNSPTEKKYEMEDNKSLIIDTNFLSNDKDFIDKIKKAMKTESNDFKINIEETNNQIQNTLYEIHKKKKSLIAKERNEN